MVHELHVGTVAAHERHSQGIQDEVGAHVRRELPADDPPREGVDDELKNTTPSQQRRYVKSASHSSSGRVALKSRLTRSGLRVADGSGVVVRHGLPRRLAPWMV